MRVKAGARPGPEPASLGPRRVTRPTLRNSLGRRGDRRAAVGLPPRDEDARGFGELRAGNLGVRVATTAAEIDAVQALRYRVFFEEMGAAPDAAARAIRRDRDAFDSAADHLVVVDHEIGPGAEGIVGTYRLIQRHAAEQVGRFYSSEEYDITPMLQFPGQVLESGGPASMRRIAAGRLCS